MFSGTLLFRRNKEVPSGKPPRHLNVLRHAWSWYFVLNKAVILYFFYPISHYFHCFWNKQLTVKGTSERIFCLIEVQVLTLHLIHIYISFSVQWEWKTWYYGSHLDWQNPHDVDWQYYYWTTKINTFLGKYIQNYCIAFEILVEQVIYLQKLYLHL